MTSLLEDAERGLFDAVGVIDIDRLTRARKSIDWEIIKDTFRKNKVVVITPSQEYNLEDEDQEFISDIFSRISAYEKKKILRRMLRGKMEKARQGKYFGVRVPYGYIWNENDKQYEIVESEAEGIRLIFNLCIEGFSAEKIQAHLSTLGYSTPVDLKGYNHRRKSKRWAKSTIIRILSNSMYAGEFIRWKHKRYNRQVLALRPQNEWIVTKVPAIITRERENRYYACCNGRRKHLDKECPVISIKAESIEDLVWDEIKRLLKNPVLLKQAIMRSDAIDPSEENLQELTRLFNDKENEEERLLDLYQIGKFDMEKLNSRMEKLKRKKDAITRDMEVLKERNKVDTRLRTINELRLELETDIDSFDFEKKRKILKILLWGKPGVGVFIKPDCSVEIRGLVDFTELSNIDKMDRVCGIENTSS